MITLAYRGSASAIITAQTLPLNPCWSPFIRGKNSAGLRPRQPKYPELDHPGLIDLGERPACARAVDRKNRVRFGGRFFREISGPVLTRIFPTPRTGPKRVRSGGGFSRSRGRAQPRAAAGVFLFIDGKNLSSAIPAASKGSRQVAARRDRRPSSSCLSRHPARTYRIP